GARTVHRAARSLPRSGSVKVAATRLRDRRRVELAGLRREVIVPGRGRRSVAHAGAAVDKKHGERGERQPRNEYRQDHETTDPRQPIYDRAKTAFVGRSHRFARTWRRCATATRTRPRGERSRMMDCLLLPT